MNEYFAYLIAVRLTPVPEQAFPGRESKELGEAEFIRDKVCGFLSN